MNNTYQEKTKKFGLLTYTTIRVQTKGVEEMLKSNDKQEELVTLRNVDITYGRGSKSFRAVSDLNLNIYKGEVLGLVGESGSGKSTIGKALVGLVPYSFGEIKLLGKKIPNKLARGFKFGKKLKEYNEVVNFLVNKVQMIFQDPANSLNPHINVESVVSEGLSNTKNSKEIYLYNKDQEFQKNVYDLIDSKKYPQFYGEYLEKLNVKIATNEDIAFEEFYNVFLNDIAKTKGLEEATKLLNELKIKREELSKLTENQCKRILVVEILKSVGLDESVLPRYPLEFSGGQQQRIGISRAVVLRPQLLVADEPISALDVSIQAQVVNIFNDLKDKYNLTILFIAHDLRMVEYISDRIAVMNKGRILEIGKTEEIINNPLHPYTKALLEAVPSIHGDKGSLLGYQYDINIHKYSENNQPEWLKVNENHFILATKEELKKWKNGEYE